MFFKIKCRIISIYKNKLIISIDHHESQIKINNVLEYCKKKGDNIKLPINNKINEYKIHTNNNTKFNINKINYHNINDLIGIELFITGFTKYYYFSSNESYKCNIDNDLEIEILPKKIIVRGYTFVATKIITCHHT